MRPGRVAQFVRDARQTRLGPHLAVMYHGATHPDREAIVEYGEHGVRRLTWGELDAIDQPARRMRSSHAACAADRASR